MLTSTIYELLLVPLFEFEKVFKQSNIMDEVKQLNYKLTIDSLNHISSLCTNFIYNNVENPIDLTKCYRFTPTVEYLDRKKFFKSDGFKWIGDESKMFFSLNIETLDDQLRCFKFNVFVAENTMTSITQKIEIELNNNNDIKFLISNPDTYFIDYIISVLGELIKLDTIFKSKLQYLMGGVLSYKNNLIQ